VGAEELAVRFAGKDPEPEKWEGIGWSESEGSPRLDAALAWIACELTDEHEGGDHVILIGRVVAAEAREGAPLLFHRGAYRDLLAESD
jgi:flavin reductase (DIM6/NTAB) family NADH-FMN oxidoreductase RutF